MSEISSVAKEIDYSLVKKSETINRDCSESPVRALNIKYNKNSCYLNKADLNNQQQQQQNSIEPKPNTYEHQQLINNNNNINSNKDNKQLKLNKIELIITNENLEEFSKKNETNNRDLEAPTHLFIKEDDSDSNSNSYNVNYNLNVRRVCVCVSA
jgi:hypothetical protein